MFTQFYSETSGRLLKKARVYQLRWKIRRPNGPTRGLEGVIDTIRKWCDSPSYFADIVNERLLGVALATPKMREHYLRFPEVVQMDGTYKVNRHGYALYHVTVTDNHGKPNSVLVAYVSAETLDHIRWVVGQFQHFHGHAAAQSLVTVIMDKCYMEWRAWSEAFPNVDIILCQVHAERTMKVQTLKKCRGVSKKVRRLFKTAMRTLNRQKLWDCLERIKMLAPGFYDDYFYPNWVECLDMWTSYYRLPVVTFGDDTTNKIESLNAVIKTFANSGMSLDASIDAVMEMIEMRMEEFQQREMDSFHTKEYDVDDNNLRLLLQGLTHYAGEKVLKHYNLHRHDVATPRHTATCDCDFFTTWQLPCIHVIIGVRRGLITPGEVISKCRWRATYTCTSGDVGRTEPDDGDDPIEGASVALPDGQEPTDDDDKENAPPGGCAQVTLLHRHPGYFENEQNRFYYTRSVTDNLRDIVVSLDAEKFREAHAVMEWMKRRYMGESHDPLPPGVFPTPPAFQNAASSTGHPIPLPLGCRPELEGPSVAAPSGITLTTYNVGAIDVRNLGRSSSYLPRLQVRNTRGSRTRGRTRRHALYEPKTQGHFSDPLLVCKSCHQRDPPNRTSRDVDPVRWVRCQQCHNCFHAYCQGFTNERMWRCGECRDNDLPDLDLLELS